MIFGIKTDKDEIVLNYHIETNNRLNRVDMVKNPFSNSRIGFIMAEDKIFLVCDLKPVWPSFAPYIFLSGAFGLTFGFYKIAWALFVLAALLSFLWSRYFFYLMFLAGLRKKGYNGRISIISDQTLLKVVTHG